MTEIRTGRLLLRRVRSEDVAPFHRMLSDPTVMAYWSTPPHADLAETRRWVDMMMAVEPAEGDDFVIEQDGALVGKAGFHRFPEIGIALRRESWGRGLAAEALRAVIARGFAFHRLPAIDADVDPRNAASLRLLARLGFVETGRRARTTLVGDRWCDSVYLRLAPPCEASAT